MSDNLSVTRDGMTDRERLIRDEFCFDSDRDSKAAHYLIGVIDTIRLDRKLLRDRLDAERAAHSQTTQAADKLAEYLTLVAPEVCSYMCPSVKYTADPWPHCRNCRNLRAALAQYAALKNQKK